MSINKTFPISNKFVIALYFLIFLCPISVISSIIPGDVSGAAFGPIIKNSYAMSISLCPDGGYAIAARVRLSLTSNYRYYLLKLNSQLQVLSDSEDGCPDNSDDLAYSDFINVVVCTNSGIYFAGRGTSACSALSYQHAFLWKRTSTFAAIFSNNFNGNAPFGFMYELTDLEILTDGSILLTAYQADGTNWYAEILRYLDDGTQLLDKPLPGIAHFLWEMAIIDSQSAVTVGNYFPDNSAVHSAIVIFNYGDGAVYYNQIYMAPSMKSRFMGVSLMSTGGFFVVGCVIELASDAHHILMIKYSDQLASQWSLLGSGDMAVYRKVRELANGNFMIIGQIKRPDKWVAWFSYFNAQNSVVDEYYEDISAENFAYDFVLPDQDGSAVVAGWMLNGAVSNIHLWYRAGCGTNEIFSSSDEATCNCKFGYMRHNGECLIPNTNGFNFCTSINECVDSDPTRAECAIKFCICRANYRWVQLREGCFALNNKLVDCNGDADCYLLSADNGFCNANKKCDCMQNYIWDQDSNRCLGLNNLISTCTSKTDCIDSRSSIGDCIFNKCSCTFPYIWPLDTTIHKCLLPNENVGSCIFMSDCADSDPTRAKCELNQCVCLAPYSIYNANTQKCSLPNDGTLGCLNVEDCADSDGTRAYCDIGSCKCKYNYIWDITAKKCKGKSDLSAYCNTISDCYDTSCSSCDNNECKCIPHHGWAYYANKCKPYNDNSQYCLTVSDCYDYGDRADCVSNKCTCKPDHIIDNAHLCKGKNNGFGPCLTISDCVDKNTINAQCTDSHLCECNQDYAWNEQRNLCLGENTGLSTCSNENDCMVGAPLGTCLGNTCDCLDGFKYDNVKVACLAYNNGEQICATVDECLDFSSNALCDGICKCATNYLWDETQFRCIGKNNELSSCVTINDCFDNSIRSYCSWPEQRCGCTDLHSWDETAKKCLCSVGTYSCAGNGFSACAQCSEGSYQDNVGKNSCTPCPAQTYLPTIKGVSLSNCLSCPAYSASGEGSKICTCFTGYFYDSSFPLTAGSQYCRKCHPFCTECDTQKDDCSQCVNTNPGISLEFGKCICEHSKGYFVLSNSNYEQDQCLKCNPLCKTCHGPTNFDCDECAENVGFLNTIDGGKCLCFEGYYFDLADPPNYCKPCDKFCKNCEGVSTNCTECVDNPGVVHTGKCECINPGYFEYYNSTSPNFHKEECVKCHPLCKKCIGPLTNQCGECYILEKGAKFISPDTCACEPNFFYDSNQEKCMKCHPLCKSCSDYGNDNCIECNKTISFSVEAKTGLCISDCMVISGYYRKDNECKKCHTICGECYGPFEFQCLKCKDPTKAVYNGECISECPSHYFNYEGICYECHETCLNCIDSTSSGCISCKSDLLFYKNQCYTKCPDYTYEFNNTDCKICQDPCEKCSSADKCLKCSKGKYWLRSQNKCVSTDDCQSEFMYGDDNSGFCEPCHFSCKTCFGPSSNDCSLCNYEKGFSRSNENENECYLTACPDGLFLQIDLQNQVTTCEKCDDSCKTCNQLGSSNCTQCKTGLTPYPSDVVGNFICKSCSEMNPGFSATINDKCDEICGDGKNMGKYECDDGNLINGDGCNEFCMIEEGYKCTHKMDEPDICIDIKAPSAVLEVKKGNLLVIQFTESVAILVDSDILLSEFMKITIEGLKEECELNSQILNTFSANASITTIYLHVNATCTLKGVIETYIINFLQLSLIKDHAGNALDTPILKAKTMRSIYISEAEKAAIEGSGSAFSVSSMTTFGVVIGISMLQSTVLNGFWAFVNMVQILSYIPILNLEIPYNLEIFLTEYLSVARVAIPFKMLPKIIPNPFDFLSSFITDSLGENFRICGYETFSFIYNFGEELTTWAFLFAFYLVLAFLDAVLPEKSCKFIRRWKKDYEYNGIIRILIETNMNLVFCAFLNVWIAHPINTARKISLAGAALASFLTIGFFAKSFHWVEFPIKKLKSKYFKEAYGNIVEELKITKRNLLARYYYPIYILRRIFYAIILIVLIDYPYIQIWLILLGTSLPMLLYLCIVKPFTTKMSNNLNIYNEAVVLISFLSVAILNLRYFKRIVFMNVGWFLISIILLSLISSWIIIMPTAIKELFQTAKECFTNNNDNEKSQKEVINKKPHRNQESSATVIKMAGQNIKIESEANLKNNNTDMEFDIKNNEKSNINLKDTDNLNVHKEKSSCGNK